MRFGSAGPQDDATDDDDDFAQRRSGSSGAGSSRVGGGGSARGGSSRPDAQSMSAQLHARMAQLQRAPAATNVDQMVSALENLSRKAGTQRQPLTAEYGVNRFESRRARFSALNRTPQGTEITLHKALVKALGGRKLYTHQATAIGHAFDGWNVIVATGTGSGKSTCYMVPVLDALLNNASSRALLIYPQKALIQDQLQSFQALADGTKRRRFRINSYDGDTPAEDRKGIRSGARAILTNPEMVHLSMCGKHQAWEKFFTNLEYVVIDEAHVYGGIFGAHVACTIRRLLRICHHYGSYPQFILCSATVSNPIDLARNLTGLKTKSTWREVKASEDGSPMGQRAFVLWNPPLMNHEEERGREGATRKKAMKEAPRLLKEICAHGLKSIAFVQARRMAEQLSNECSDMLKSSGHAQLASQVQSYRAGYDAATRQAIERRLNTGELQCVVSTSALELGVDVGELDATLQVGFPGSIASLWQQAGRAGRGGRASVNILVMDENAVDQHYYNQRLGPEGTSENDIFSVLQKAAEAVVIDATNQVVALQHLLAAAQEKVITWEDHEFFGGNQRFARLLALACDGEDAKLRQTVIGPVVEDGQGFGPNKDQSGASRWEYIGFDTDGGGPHMTISMRSARGGMNITVIEEGSNRIIEEHIDLAMAKRDLHDGAIYLHQREKFIVKKLDLTEGKAVVKEFKKCPYFTQVETEFEILQNGKPLKSKPVSNSMVHWADLQISFQVTSFQRTLHKTGKVLGSPIMLKLPPESFPTKGLFFDLPIDVSERICQELGSDAQGHAVLQSVANSLHNLLPTLMRCDVRDVRTYVRWPKAGSMDMEYDGGHGVDATGQAGGGGALPRIYIYDDRPGGLGIARALQKELCKPAGNFAEAQVRAASAREQGATAEENSPKSAKHFLRHALDCIEACPCTADWGCPACIQARGRASDRLHKKGAMLCLRLLLLPMEAEAEAIAKTLEVPDYAHQGGAGRSGRSATGF